MKKDKNIYVWERLSEYLDDKMKDFVIDIFDNCFDYSIPKSWDLIIAELVKIIHYRATSCDKKGTKVVQVKTKFGELRFYTEGEHDDYIYGAIKMAEAQAHKICPACSSFDKPRTFSGRYLKGCVRCEDMSFEMT
tara:strand:- start:16508 stop:16912 length:405 start_codon:yes stop_codon:yes gene_type:complete